MDIVKIVAIAIVCALLCAVLKQYKPEFAIVVQLAASVFILLLIASAMGGSHKRSERFDQWLGDQYRISYTAAQSARCIRSDSIGSRCLPRQRGNCAFQ